MDLCIPQIKTNKAGRPASLMTKKKMRRLAKECQGRKAIGGNITDTTVTNQDQDQDDPSDEANNTGDMNMSSEEGGKSETDEEVEEMEGGISRFLSALFLLSFIIYHLCRDLP